MAPLNKILFFFALGFTVVKSYANDSTVYIVFLKKATVYNEFQISSIKQGGKLYIINQNSDSSAMCYVIKADNVVGYGNLKIFENKLGKRIAVRSGYWKYFDLRKKDETIFFYSNDKKVSENLPKVIKAIGVFPNAEVIEQKQLK